jgi:hydroxymethylbilane synthase
LGDLLQQAHPDLHVETVIISTQGDRLKDRPLPDIGGKGLFTEELEQALRDRSIDIAVHSLKDLPTTQPAGLVLGATLARACASDVLVSRDGFTPATLPAAARVGTSSTRRKAQLLAHRPDLAVIDIRGNADTRLRKLRNPGDAYDAIVMAHAALLRLGESCEPGWIIPEHIMLPAPGQGAIAAQCRDERETLELLEAVSDPATDLETTAERAFLAGLGGGCAVPVAALGDIGGAGSLWLRGRVCSSDGAHCVDLESETSLADGMAGIEGRAKIGRAELRRQACEAGTALAKEALDRGAAGLLTGSLSRSGGLGA